MVAVPSAIEVTKPADEMVATAVFDELHVIAAPDTVLPSASVTVAARVAVSPIELKLTVVGERLIDEAV